MASYTLPNGLTTDWSVHDSTWKPGVDRNWKVVDWKLVPWVKKMIATVADLPVSPSNGDAYMIGGTEVRRWNTGTTSYDIFPLTGNFLFYDQFTGNFYSWVAGTIAVVFVTTLNTNGDMLYFDTVLKRLPAGADLDVIQYVGGLPTTAALPFYGLKLSRPAFRRHASINTNLILNATALKKATIKIGNAFYSNVSDRVLNTTVTGRNGLDTGSLAAATVYYLYGIPPLTGATFDLVLSTDGPATGPTGFADFTYLGSMATDVGAPSFNLFTYANGFYQSNGTGSTATVSSSTEAGFVLPISEVAVSVKLRGLWTAVQAAGNQLIAGPGSTNLQNYMQAGSATAGLNAITFFDIPIETPQTVHAKTTHNDDSVELQVWGWHENPDDFE